MDRNRLTLIPGPLRAAFLNLVDPVADWLIRWHVQPNTITVASVVVLFGSGIAFGSGFPRIGAFWLLLSGLLDILDGKVARRGGTTSAFGAFFDSTLDRLGEAALFAGIAMLLVRDAPSRSLEDQAGMRGLQELALARKDAPRSAAFPGRTPCHICWTQDAEERCVLPIACP